MNAPPYTLTNESITVIWEGKSHTVQKGAPNYKALRDAVLAENWNAIPANLTVQKSLHEWAKGAFTLEGNRFFFNKEPLPEELNGRIIEMATRGNDPTPLMKFWERLQKNPSYRSVQMLFSFLRHQGIPLTEDGCFLAYKGVRTDYKDAHSGQFDNSPGAMNEMPRNKISDDPKVACHEGFHVGALAYAKTFSQRVVVCKVDPADVVCVPYDESQHKMRVSKYKVIGNHNGVHLPNTVFVKDEYDTVTKEAERPAVAPVEAVDDDPDYDADNDPLAEDYEQDESEPVQPRNYFLNEQHELPKEKASDKEKPSEERRASKKGFTKFDKMGLEQLMECSIDDLRKYAGKGLEIVGASKIPGGKTALVRKILDVRK
jgi:hypothetical protein